jgi:hypothetical protein
MELVVESVRTGFQDGADLRRQIRDATLVGALAWGHAPGELSGWRLVVRDGEVGCGSAGDHHNGCTDDSRRTITISTDGATHFAHTSFMHEVLHVFLAGDGDHSDTQWWDCPQWLDPWRWANTQSDYAEYYRGDWVGDGGQGLQACSPSRSPGWFVP